MIFKDRTAETKKGSMKTETRSLRGWRSIQEVRDSLLLLTKFCGRDVVATTHMHTLMLTSVHGFDTSIVSTGRSRL